MRQVQSIMMALYHDGLRERLHELGYHYALSDFKEPAQEQVSFMLTLIDKIQHPHRRVIERLFLDQDGECFYCGKRMFIFPTALSSQPGRQRSGHEATIDHIVPRAQGGANTRGNRVAACNKCNHTKADMAPPEFLGLAWMEVA